MIVAKAIYFMPLMLFRIFFAKKIVGCYHKGELVLIVGPYRSIFTILYLARHWTRHGGDDSYSTKIGFKTGNVKTPSIHA